VRVWYERDALLGTHNQCTGGTSAPREYQGHSGFVDAQEHDIIEELLQAMQLLHVIRPGFFSSWSTADRYYQAWGLHMDREIIGSL
jgi:hypothetical protein